MARTRDWLVPLAAMAALVVATGALLILRKQDADQSPPPCRLYPVAYHPGSLVRFDLGSTGIEGAHQISAIVALDDGRRITAFNATTVEIPDNKRVMVSEIVCVHRTIYLLTEFKAPTGPK